MDAALCAYHIADEQHFDGQEQQALDKLAGTNIAQAHENHRQPYDRAALGDCPRQTVGILLDLTHHGQRIPGCFGVRSRSFGHDIFSLPNGPTQGGGICPKNAGHMPPT